MNTSAIDTETPAYLIPRMDDLPISNVRTFRTAVVTQVKAPENGVRSNRKAEWTVTGSYSSQVLAINAIAVSPKGSFIASGDKNGALYLWDVAQSRQIGAAGISHEAAVTRIVFSPDESLAASMDASGTVILWETGTGRQHGEALAADPAFGLAFSPQGALLIGQKDGPQTFFQFVPKPAQSILSFSLQPSLAVGLRRVDVIGEKRAFIQTGSNRWDEVDATGAAAYHFDETGRTEWSVVLLDSSRGIALTIDLFHKQIRDLSQPPGSYLYNISFPDSFTAVEASFVGQNPVLAAGDVNGTLSFWTTPAHASGLRRAEVGTGNTKSGAFVQTGVKKWDEVDVSGATVYQFDETGRDDWSVYLNDPSRAGGVSIQIDLHTRKTLYSDAQNPRREEYDVLAVAFFPVAAPSPPWSEDPSQIRSIRALAISADGTLVAAGDKGGQIRLWRWATGQQVGTFMLKSAVKDLTFSPDGSVLASLDENGTLSQWDLTTGQLLPDYQQGPPLQAAAFSADWSLLAEGSGNGTITLFRDTRDILAQPLSLPQPGGLAQKGRSAEGVLLIHEQSWVMQGLALGELLHSVCLAPGEITQIAVTSHSSRTMQQSVDTAGQDEALLQTSAEASSVSESERAAAGEASFGSSLAMSAGASAQAGASFLVGSVGSSMNASTALTASFSSGTRNVSDESNQRVHQAAEQGARVSRRLYSAAVREVSESDNVELRTRVVANYNHMHALNVQYYEVVQVQRLRTRITDAFRLLFLPMQIIDFADPRQCSAAATRFRRELVDVARSLGLTSVAVCLDSLGLGETFTTDLIAYRLAEAWNRVSELDKAVADQDKIIKEGKALSINCEDSVYAARDALRRFNANHEDASQLERAKLQRTLQAALEQSRLAEARQAVALATAQRLRTDRDNAAALRKQLGTVINPFLTDPSKPVLDKEQFAAIERIVFKALADNQLAVNQGLWMRIDPSTYTGLLQGQAVNGESLAATVDPTPIAIAGNFLGFRWHHSDPMAEMLFRARFVGTEAMEDSIALPTSGVFGEAVLGDSNAAEKIDLTRFWNWSEALAPIRPTEIAALKQPTGQAPAAPTLPNVAVPGTQLGPIVFPQVASGAPMLADALKNPDLFRDMSGSKASAALARSAVELAAKGSSEAAKVAQKSFKRQLAFQQKMAETFLDKGGAKGAAGDGKRDLDPTLAGGLLNSNPNLEARGESALDESSSGLGNLSEKLRAQAEAGEESESDRDSLEIQFVEEDKS